MLKKFLKNIALVLFLNLLIKPFWILGIDRSVQNHVGVADYGFYYSIFSFSFLLNILLDFGITNFNNKNIAQNNHLLRKHLSSIIVLKLMLGGIYLVLSVICAFIIRYNSLQILLLLVLAFNQFLISFVLYLRSNISGLHLFKIDSCISVLDRTIMIIVCAFLLWGMPSTFEFTIRTYAFAQTFAYGLTALITLIIVFRKAKSKFLKLNWNFPFSLMIIKKSFPFAVLVLLMTFYNRIDTVMMERILPDASTLKDNLLSGEVQCGIYASAYRLLDATNMIAVLFAGLLLPLFAKMIKHKESVEALVRLSFSMLFTGAIIISFCSFFYSSDIMHLLYPFNPKGHENLIDYTKRIEESSRVFGYLMGCFIPISTTYVFGTLLTANGNLKQLNIMAASGMAINIMLNLFLIPRFFAIGSSFASFSTQFVTSLIQVILVQLIFKFKMNYRFLFSLLIFVIGVIGIGFVSRLVGSHWTTNLICMVAISGILAIVLRIINFRDMFNIIKNE
ncbi:MAG: polysaccharide biosynthesis C-terminal domain-containing protein [Bacteroidales bacterium]|jgi:O-antigen/teichoic acid export membrane protein